MRSTGKRLPPLIGYVLAKPICCPECNDNIVPADMATCIYTDVICKKCELIIMEIIPFKQFEKEQKQPGLFEKTETV